MCSNFTTNPRPSNYGTKHEENTSDHQQTIPAVSRMRILTHVSPMHLNANYPLSHQWLATILQMDAFMLILSLLLKTHPLLLHLLTELARTRIQVHRRSFA